MTAAASRPTADRAASQQAAPDIAGEGTAVL